MLLVDYFYQAIRTAHAKDVLLFVLGQTQGALVVFFHVNCHVTYAFVFSQVPKSKIAVMSTGDQLIPLRSKQDRSNGV
jgi:hypothetical protein